LCEGGRGGGGVEGGQEGFCAVGVIVAEDGRGRKRGGRAWRNEVEKVECPCLDDCELLSSFLPSTLSHPHHCRTHKHRHKSAVLEPEPSFVEPH